MKKRRKEEGIGGRKGWNELDRGERGSEREGRKMKGI